MCRYQASELWAKNAELESIGVNLYVAVKEDIGTEVADFRSAAWSGDVFVDEEMAFFKAQFGGNVCKDNLARFLWNLVSLGSVGRRLRAAMSMSNGFKKGSNTTGEGFIKGGLYVINKGGVAEYVFGEDEIGDFVPLDEVMAAAYKTAFEKPE